MAQGGAAQQWPGGRVAISWRKLADQVDRAGHRPAHGAQPSPNEASGLVKPWRSVEDFGIHSAINRKKDAIVFMNVPAALGAIEFLRAEVPPLAITVVILTAIGAAESDFADGKDLLGWLEWLTAFRAVSGGHVP